jgi:hypothetical protein
MARQIRETPILFGEDALRFMERSERVENMTREERLKNLRELESQVANAKNKIEVCW